MTCTWSGSWCAWLMRCWPALLLLFHFFRKSGFWVACQVLFAKILTNFMSALFIRRCWCFGPRPAGAEYFCNNGFFAINDAAEWERICSRGGGRFEQTSFSILFIFYFKVGHFFSPVVLEIHMYYNRKNILFHKKKNHINSLQTWRERKKGTQVMTGIFSHLLFMSVWSLTIYQVSALSFLNI